MNFLENSTHIFDDIPRTPTNPFMNGKRLGYSRNVDKFGDEYYGLFNGKQLVAILTLEHDRLGKPQLTQIITADEFRGQGLMRFLMNKALEHHAEIYSDTHQTPESIYFWKMLLMYPEPNYTIFVYDTTTNTKTPFIRKSSKYYSHDISYGSIWNEKDNPILVIVKNAISESKILDNIRKDNILKRHGRDSWSIWYGDYRADRGYLNP